MLNLQIAEWEVRFEVSVRDYFVDRTRLGLTEDRLCALISDYTERWRQRSSR